MGHKTRTQPSHEIPHSGKASPSLALSLSLVGGRYLAGDNIMSLYRNENVVPFLGKGGLFIYICTLVFLIHRFLKCPADQHAV